MIKRRLTDLYVLGKEITFDDGGGDPVVVYIRKMSPVDQENSIRRANAARARFLSASHDPDSDVTKDLLNQAMDLGDKADLIDFLNVGKLATIRAAKEAELADEEEWKKDGYLQGLYDAWNDGLDLVHALNDMNDPKTEEAVRVFNEMKRFMDEVDESMVEDMGVLKDTMEAESILKLQEEVAKELVDLNANSAWLREYRRCEVWFCTKEVSDPKKRYFVSREEVDELPSEVYNRLVNEITGLVVDPVEGKDLPLKDSSSPLSELPEQEVTTLSSGPLSVVL